MSCVTTCFAGNYIGPDGKSCEPCPAHHFCVNLKKYHFSHATVCPPGTRVETALSASTDRTEVVLKCWNLKEQRDFL